MSLGGSRSRALGIVERINITEGEGDGDDLDMVPPEEMREIEFEEFYESIGAGQHNATSSGDSDGQQSGKRKRPTVGKEKGERIAFDDNEDSDAAYKAHKKSKSESKKKARASTMKAKAKVSKNSVVGRKHKTVVPLKHSNKDHVYGADSDDDNALMENTLPAYLQDRKSEWEQTRDKLGAAGLRIAPSYDDVEFSDDERLESLKERPKLPSSIHQREYKDVELPFSAGIIPAPIAQYLRDYQVDGAAFLHELFVYQKGGILGDDMGLGKTIQVIAFLTAAFGKTGDERDSKRMRKMRRMNDERWYPRVLIVAPGGLMANWKAELERWGWWQIYTYHGSGGSKEDAIAAAQQGRLEIMITTYSTYRTNPTPINSIRWDCVVADECHIIKEPRSETTKLMTEINALCRIGLTGTAIQNNYEELWTLLNWTNPGHFGPLAIWKQAISLPLKLGQSHDATISQLSRGRRTAEKLVRNLLPPFFKRRMKSLIADQLPKKSDQVVFCPLTETQAQAYNNLCDSELIQIIQTASDPCNCGSGKKQGYCCYTMYRDKTWQSYVFPCLVALRSIANHVALLLPAGETDRDKHDREMDRLRIALPDSWSELYRQRENIMNYAKTEFCGKWKVLRKLLKYWHDNGDKALVFSHSVRLLRMLKLLFASTTTYNVAYLDGSMSLEDRQKTVDDYNSDPAQFVFLISSKAGGVGLNITSANKVVVVDPNWNPSYDLQAQDRAYRIGQARDVQVFRLVSAGTIEEIVYARQIYKQQQANIGYNASVERRYFRGVQDQKDMKGEIFGLGNMFAPLSDNIRLRDIVNNTNIAETRAGVEIAGLEFETTEADDDDEAAAAADPANSLFSDAKEDAAISALAADIIGAPAGRRPAAAAPRRKDPVQAILASVGVNYTHENAEVIGTSKIETRISHRAQKAGNDIDLNAGRAFARPEDEPGEGQRGKRSAPRPVYDDDGSEELEAAEPVRYLYHPPEDVRRRQFCTMARHFGYDDVTEFALVVEGWTQGQRRDCLERFYRDRRARPAEASG